MAKVGVTDGSFTTGNLNLATLWFGMHMKYWKNVRIFGIINDKSVY